MAITIERFEFNVATEKLVSPCPTHGCGNVMMLRLSPGARIGFATPGIYANPDGEYVYQNGQGFWYLSCGNCGHTEKYSKAEPHMQ